MRGISNAVSIVRNCNSDCEAAIILREILRGLRGHRVGIAFTLYRLNLQCRSATVTLHQCLAFGRLRSLTLKDFLQQSWIKEVIKVSFDGSVVQRVVIEAPKNLLPRWRRAVE